MSIGWKGDKNTRPRSVLHCSVTSLIRTLIEQKSVFVLASEVFSLQELKMYR